MRLAFQKNRLAGDRLVSGESRQPNVMAQDGEGGSANDILFRRKFPADRRQYAQHTEVAGTDALRRNSQGACLRHKTHRRRQPGVGRCLDRCHFGHGLPARAIQRHRSAPANLDAVAGKYRAHGAQAFRLWIRNRFEQDGINEREHRGVGANCETEREDCREKKPRRLDQLAPAVFEIVGDHACPFRRICRAIRTTAYEVTNLDGPGTPRVGRCA